MPKAVRQKGRFSIKPTALAEHLQELVVQTEAGPTGTAPALCISLATAPISPQPLRLAAEEMGLRQGLSAVILLPERGLQVLGGHALAQAVFSGIAIVPCV